MSAPWYFMAKGKGGGGYKTASGPIVSVNDALAAPLRSLLVNIEPVQAGTGDPSPDNVRPISGWSAVNVWRTGKNLFDGNFRKGYYGADGVYYATPPAISNAANTTPILVKAGARYFFATEKANGNSILWYDKDMTLISANTNAPGNVEIEAPENAAFLNFRSNVSNYDSAKASINYPSTDHDYHSYSGNQYTIQLGQTVYGGTLDVTNGVLTVDRAMVDMGTLTWGFDGQATHRFIAYNQLDAKPSGSYSIAVPCVCSSYPTRTQNQTASGIMGISIQAISGNSAFIYDESYSDVTTFQSAMSGIKLVYPLATPITIPLTPQEISTLQGQNNVWADSGDITIEYLASGGVNADLMKLAVAFMGRK